MTTTLADYKHFLANHAMPWCWACGRDECDVPPGWFGPWLIERAHIFRFPVRPKDVRSVVLLCSLCHKTSHWERVFLQGQINPLPRLYHEHLLYLKRRFDRDNYDREWLKDHCAGTLPRSQQLPRCYLTEYRQRRAA